MSLKQKQPNCVCQHIGNDAHKKIAGFCSNVTQAFTGSHYGQGSQAPIVYNLGCKGTETDLIQCAGSWGTDVSSLCQQKSDASVNCAGGFTDLLCSTLIVGLWFRLLLEHRILSLLCVFFVCALFCFKYDHQKS